MTDRRVLLIGVPIAVSDVRPVRVRDPSMDGNPFRSRSVDRPKPGVGRSGGATRTFVQAASRAELMDARPAGLGERFRRQGTGSIFSA
jgi:hypothetical protein